MKATSRAEPVARTEPMIEYRNRFLEVHHTRVAFHEFEKDYYVIKFKRRAGVVAVRDGLILLTQQYRFLLNRLSWELPGGTIEDGESVERGLRRECLEETGMELLSLQPLVQYYPGLDNVDNETSLFVCRDPSALKPFVANPAEVEAIDWMPVDRCLEMISRREILDAMTIVGLLAFAQTRQR